MNADERRLHAPEIRHRCNWCGEELPPCYVYATCERCRTLPNREHRAIEAMGWVALVLSVVGVLLNNARLWPCFLFWILSNAISAWVHYRFGPRSLMIRDLIFLALSCVGLWQWTR